METVCNKLEKSMMEVKVTFTTEEWKKAQEKALDKLAKNVKMDGFRKGHVPKQMIKARLGKGAILEEATDMIRDQLSSKNKSEIKNANTFLPRNASRKGRFLKTKILVVSGVSARIG